MNRLEILKAVDAKLSDESKWTKGRDAMGASGFPLAVDDPNAVKWCLGGAIMAIVGDQEKPENRQAFLSVRTLLDQFVPAERIGPNAPAINFNDDPATTFYEVKAILAAAIKRAESEEVPA